MQSFSSAPRQSLRAAPKAKQGLGEKPTRRIPQGLVLYESALDSFSCTGERLGKVSTKQRHVDVESPLSIDRIESKIQDLRETISKDDNTKKKVRDFRCSLAGCHASTNPSPLGGHCDGQNTYNITTAVSQITNPDESDGRRD
jgi:hypothetical protein